jgi:hypothetical protein
MHCAGVMVLTTIYVAKNKDKERDNIEYLGAHLFI